MHSVIIHTQACYPTLPFQPPKRCVLTSSRPTHDNLTKKSVRQNLKKTAAKLPTRRTTGRERPSSKTLDRTLNLPMYFLRKKFLVIVMPALKKKEKEQK